MTNAQIATAMEAAARTIAAIAVAVYVAGEFAGRFIHRMNDWLADASHHPGQAAGQALGLIARVGDAIIPPPSASAEPLLAAGAVLMTVQDLAREIAEYEKKQQPAARRKPARARKVKEAA
jgi:hypothetical protein